MSEPRSSAVVRFGAYELNLDSAELRKAGIKIRLQEQPFRILAMLLERPGQVVSREQLCQQLWPNDTFVDFEHGLNRAINKLRVSLCDSAEVPRYIETIPKHGYRFLPPVVRVSPVQRGAESQARSLAVVPFSNLSGTDEADSLCDELTEALTYQLAELPSLKVMAHATVFRYKETQLEAQSVGRELGVDAVLSGRVWLRDHAIRITAELVDTRDGSLIWGHHWRLEVADLLRVQEEIARAIFENLRLKLTQRDLDRAYKRHTQNVEAHQLYLRGICSWYKREYYAVRKAIEYFQQALQADPAYALAYAGLADAFAVLGIFPYSYLSPHEAMPKAKAAALRALELDPDLAEAHTTLGLVHCTYEWKFAESEQEFRRALELKPNYPTAHLWHCVYLIAMGKLDEALVEARKTQELDPLSPIGSSLPGVVLYYDRQFEPALAALENLRVLDSSFPVLHLFAGYAECALGRYSQAVESFNRTMQLLPGVSTVALSRLGWGLGLAGRRSEAEEVLRKLEQIGRERYVPAHAHLFVRLGLKQYDEAFRALDAMVQEHNDYLVYLRPHPAIDPLRGDERLTRIAEQVGLGDLALPAAVAAAGH